MPGPIPNRSTDLSRERDANRANRPELVKGVALPVTIPGYDTNWHKIAIDLWVSLRTSGQAAYYQNSDWMYAYSVCDDLSEYKKSGRRSAQMAQVIYSAMSNLLITEADRRRIRIELSPPEAEEEPASVTAIGDYKNRLGVAN